MPRRSAPQPSPPKPPDLDGYPIGVVSRLTNIHPETLRVWERRYALVRPLRGARSGRLYSEEDVRRLSLVKQLVDAGHPVSLVAGLSMEALRARLQATPVSSARSAEGAAGPCRVVVVGDTLGARFSHAAAHYSDLEIVGAWSELSALGAQVRTLRPEVALVELATVHSDAVARMHQLMADSGAKGAVLVFGFGARSALRRLEESGVQCLQAPVTDSEIRRACLGARSQPSLLTAGAQQLPARQFSAEQLARVAATVPTIACECPHHLVDLISALAAFETYSGECLHRNPKDAEIHAFLQTTAAAALALLEQGLARVIEHEGLQL
jgi:MerR family transcriptional regulator, light-induced transcriptional regulator